MLICILLAMGVTTVYTGIYSQGYDHFPWQNTGDMLSSLPGFSRVHCFVGHCLSIYPFCLAIMFAFLRFTASDYSFDILDLRLLITPLVS
jgi:hypothetical protein